ncbi:hypothetical protein B0T24DRAFT_588482 [Lasiosphaeria ovina]|uniref:Uncharacterized protein n=1 Tax=Lasiosphaeria ovina TaxID=92902 RepID=A0AAE0NLU7_9PEZI|nr:hypothetical protein B0T24DRAFT_588482 [Lasiosphaeria ovina]
MPVALLQGGQPELVVRRCWQLPGLNENLYLTCGVSYSDDHDRYLGKPLSNEGRVNIGPQRTVKHLPCFQKDEVAARHVVCIFLDTSEWININRTSGPPRHTTGVSARFWAVPKGGRVSFIPSHYFACWTLLVLLLLFTPNYNPKVTRKRRLGLAKAGIVSLTCDRAREQPAPAGA